MTVKNLALKTALRRWHEANSMSLWLGVIGWSIGALLVTTGASAVEPDCPTRKVQFDGIVPLHYATVNGDKASTTSLYHRYPASCKEDQSACGDTEKISAGDAVAVGKTCGAWSYVQHIDDSSVTEGWLEANRLNDLPVKLPYDDGEPGGRPRSTLWRAPATVRVKLIKGQGVPVCEAYLQRLNQTVFHEPPSCGRPENDQVPGFARLNRVPLDAWVVNATYAHAYNLSHRTSDNYRLIRPFVDSRDVAALRVAQGLIQRQQPIPAVADSAGISAWRFNPQVDIDNDGQPDTVAIWRDFPPLWDKGPFHACGAQSRDAYDISPVDQVPFILYTAIDTARTVEVFGDPSPLPKALQLDPRRPTGEQEYQWIRPLGTSIDVFEYRGKYYFDTTKNPRNETVLQQNTIYVYLREHGETRDLCEYHNMDSEW
jgi:hypothetical protein